MSAVPAIGRAERETALLGEHTEAVGRLYDLHQRTVYAFCLSQLRDRDEAADAAQTTFMYALGALRRGVTPSFELPWLLAIARNVCRTRGAARTRRRHLELALDPQELAELAPAPEPVELLSGIEGALALLPEQQRRAVVLRDWQGLSYKEVADQLGVSLAAAETLIFRGRSALARELGGGEARRRFSFGSLLGVLRSTAVAGGGGGAAVKLAVGAAVVIGAAVAGTRELGHRPPVSHHAVTRTAVARTAPVPTSHAVAVALVAGRVVARPTAARTGRPRPVERRARQRSGPVAERPTPRTTPRANPAAAPPAQPTTDAKPSTEPAAAPAPAPPLHDPRAPAAPPQPSPASPPAPAARTAPASPPPVAAPPAPAATPEPAPAAPPAAPVIDVVTPAATTVTEAAPPVAPVVSPVVTTVTTVTEPVAPAVTTVTTAVTGAVTPVTTTVTSALPPPPPLPHVP